MGTPEFAIPSLKKLIESKHTIAAVVTAPDKERGRGRQLSYTPVKEFAVQNNLEILAPLNLNDENFIRRLKELEPDIFVVVAFKILPKEVYTIPKRGAFNLHGSLLPKYRGAAPIQWAIINGDKETGVTTFFLEEKVDTGNIILQEKITIDDEDDYGSLYDKMMMLGAEVVLRTVEIIAVGDVQLIKQDDLLASPAPKIKKEICRIDWNKSAEEIHNLVRGLSPHPGAYFEYNGKIYKVYKTKLIENGKLPIDNSQFAIMNLACRQTGAQLYLRIYQTKKEIYFQTSNGIIQILELQPEGRRRMTAEEFLRGYKFPL